MSLDLTARQYELLIELLLREQSDLGPEIHHTDDREFRDELKERRQLVRELLHRMEALQAVA